MRKNFVPCGNGTHTFGKTEDGRDILAEVNGPMTILEGCLKSTFKLWRKNPPLMRRILASIGGELLQQISEFKAFGVKIISYADPVGSEVILGPKTAYAKHVAQTGQKVAGKVYEGFPVLTPHACGVERYAILKEHYAEGKESADGMAHLMERVKYTQAYEADTNPFWYTEFNEGNLTIADAPMDFKAVIQHSMDTYKLHDRNVQPNNFWQTWHTSVYDLANRSLRLNIQEDYTKHYDFKLN